MIERAERYPAWCRCDEAYRSRNLLDPGCPHDEFEDVEALLDALDAHPASLGPQEVRDAYNNVAAYIRPEVPVKDRPPVVEPRQVETPEDEEMPAMALRMTAEGWKWTPQSPLSDREEHL